MVSISTFGRIKDLDFYKPHQYNSGAAFFFGKGDKPMTRSAYMWMFKKIKDKVDMHGATPHTFRHTFITAAAGRLDPKQLQEIAGHSKCDITMSRYAHTKYKSTEQTAQDLQGLYM